ncbi:MAG TPA: mechanosensitive ion channel domain-containing protein [Chthoniobacterales bacterium]
MRFAILFFSGLLALASPSPAQTKSFQSLIQQFTGAEAGANAGPPPAEQLDWVKEQIKASRDQLQQLQNEESPAELIALAEQIVRNQTFAQTTLEGVIRSESELSKLRDQPARPPLAAPAELAAAKQSAADLKSQLAAASSEQPLLQQALSEAAAAVQTNQAALLELKDAPPAQTRLAQLRAAASETALYNLKWRLYLEALHSQANEIQLQQLERGIDLSRLDVQINAGRAKEALAQLEKDRAQITEKLAAAQKTSEALSQQLKSLEEQTRAGNSSKAVQSQIQILKASQNHANQLAIGLDHMLQLMDLEVKHWNSVLELSATKDPSLFQQTREAIQGDLNRISQIKAVLLQRFQDTTRALEQLANRADANWQEKSLRPLLEKQQEIVGSRVEMLRAQLQRLEQIRSHAETLAAEVGARLLEQSFREKLAVSLGNAGSTLAGAWNFRLFTSQGTNFTVGKLAVGITGLIAAFMLAAFISRRVAGTFSRRFHADATKAVLIEKWVYYLALVLLVLTVLNWLSIPLTVFAFLGGALAIGIGFGGQNLMNNFISGLILLFERRVNVGDIVEVDGHTGKVMHLGSRSSRIRKWDGVEVLVPNSYFLEKNVINWTLSDPNHRYDFVVGVAYGSPLKHCLEIFQKVLARHPHILPSPAPFVLFESFGDNALNFHFYYWLPVNVPHIDTGAVGSELRLEIDAVCREANIEIAYPQRDVHLFTAKPIEVKVQSEKSA